MFKRTLPLLAFLSSPLALADDPPVELNGQLFAYYGLDLSEGADAANNFDLDRAYLTARHKLDDGLSVRLTTDVGRESSQSTEVSDGTGGTTSVSVPGDPKIRVFVKYAYLEWKSPSGIKLRGGSASTPWTGNYDDFWDHRYVHKSYADAQGVLDTADLGIHALGTHKDGLFDWQAGVMNGSGYGKPEGDAAKTVQLRATVDPMAGKKGTRLPISAFVSQDLGPSDDDPTTVWAAAIGLKTAPFLCWGEALGSLQGTTRGMGGSVTLMPRVEGVGSLIVRADQWDPDLATDKDAALTVVGGASHDFTQDVALAATFEQVRAQAAPDTPSSGVYLRMKAGF